MGENANTSGAGDDADENHRLSEALPSKPTGEQVLDAVPEVVVVFDLDGHAVWWNDQTTAVTGYGDAELAASDPLEKITDEDPDELLERFRDAVDEGRTILLEVELVTAEDERLPYEFIGARLPNPDGDTVGIVLTGRNIADRRARRELERQNERLDEFASVVSHDLRGPLSVAQGYISLAREDGDSDELVKAAEAIDRMGALVDDLLALAREGRAVGDTTAVDLGGAAERAWDGLGAVATLEVESSPTIEADPSRLRELLENLFRNSVEHGTSVVAPGEIDDIIERGRPADDDGVPGTDGGDVTVWVGELPGGGGFYIEDDGPGIPEGEREKVFESGYTTSENGTGFGLAIVRTIAEAHDWSVEITDGRDGGARFEISTDPV